ncbi:hypothetical protein SADUNF_Sadunf16G0210800 [Salix dunnii]|uniref:Ribosomal protein L20 n=1 Tax=Salix dunnii TaxID=1413687 RepID=A0A835J7X5_9ROSI|nr:hypothetical protein SADUNF_Sadunf16G0210800 [Salix dunnii]
MVFTSLVRSSKNRFLECFVSKARDKLLTRKRKGLIPYIHKASIYHNHAFCRSKVRNVSRLWLIEKVEHRSKIYKDALYNELEFQQQALMIPQQALNNSPEVTE